MSMQLGDYYEILEVKINPSNGYYNYLKFSNIMGQFFAWVDEYGEPRGEDQSGQNKLL